MPCRPTNTSPSMSKKMSPSFGAGIEPRPRPGSGERSSYTGFSVSLASSWTRACSRTFVNEVTLPLRGRHSIGSEIPARSPSVLTPCSCSSTRCDRCMSATKLRWSSLRHCALHVGHQRQISHCSTGSGYGASSPPENAATPRSSRAWTNRK